MITEDYVSFEVAKLLKEKGFDEKCDYCYAFFDEDDIRVLELKPSISGLSLMENRYPYVTQSVAMKWLREIHHLSIEPYYTNKQKYKFAIQEIPTAISLWMNLPDKLYSTYEKACEEAIKHCLENLI